MVNKIPRVVLDTNILISGYLFGGKPREIFKYIIRSKIKAITSPVILSELSDILRKKFKVLPHDIYRLEEEIKDLFDIVYPSQILNIVRDEADNRIIEAADEAKAEFLISGDKDLLSLKKYKKTSIISANEFIQVMRETS